MQALQQRTDRRTGSNCTAGFEASEACRTVRRTPDASRPQPRQSAPPACKPPAWRRLPIRRYLEPLLLKCIDKLYFLILR